MVLFVHFVYHSHPYIFLISMKSFYYLFHYKYLYDYVGTNDLLLINLFTDEYSIHDVLLFVFQSPAAMISTPPYLVLKRAGQRKAQRQVWIDK